MNLSTAIKVVTGIIIVPIAITASLLWPWWTTTAMPKRIISGFIVLPLVGISYVLSPWWEDL